MLPAITLLNQGCSFMDKIRGSHELGPNNPLCCSLLMLTSPESVQRCPRSFLIGGLMSSRTSESYV